MHFLNIQSRVQKIDTLEKMRVNLEPRQLSKIGTKNLMAASKQSNQFIKPVSQKQRHSIMLRILKSARIVCTTLSMSASEMFNNYSLDDFEYLIIDEACQSVELTNLIPF